MNDNIRNLLAEIQPYREKLINHPIYNDLKILEDFQFFLENHF
jgi:hypothetical protein